MTHDISDDGQSQRS